MVNFKKLNNQVYRPAHPTRSLCYFIANIPGATYFTKLDVRHGYWQVPRSNNFKALATFMIPWGRFRFLCNPQGLISAGDELNRRTDAAFQGIPNFAKIVDDCLAYDSDFKSHVQHVRDVFMCKRDHSITISPKKFELGVEEICGFQINGQGWTVDADKIAAIHDFSMPNNWTDLRSVLSLVNQFEEFTACLADLSQPLHGLLKTSTKFDWDSSHSSAVDAIKHALMSPPELSFYEPGLETFLEADPSRKKSLGFAL